MYVPEPRATSETIGVGQERTSAPKCDLLAAPGLGLRLKPVETLASGVGQDEQPLSAVGSSGIVRAQTTPLRIEPHRGQVPEDSVETPGSESCDVFHEDEAGSYLAHDPSEVRPEARPLPVDALALPGVADVLAGEAASDEIHDSTPRAAVKGGDIRPHRARSQPTFFHLADQSGSGESFPLHEHDRASADSLESKGQSSAPGEQFDGT
jgi:hypothetical protein